MLNVQLDRLDGMIARDARREEARSSRAPRSLDNLGLKPAPMNSPDHDCATQVMYTLPSAEAANRFVEIFPSVIAGKTGRHTYTEWDQVLMGAGAAHPAMNPYNMPANAECRRTYSKDMCARSLDILDRTVMVATNPEHTAKEIDDIIHNIGVAARVVLGGADARGGGSARRGAGRRAEVRYRRPRTGGSQDLGNVPGMTKRHIHRRGVTNMNYLAENRRRDDGRARRHRPSAANADGLKDAEGRAHRLRRARLGVRRLLVGGQARRRRRGQADRRRRSSTIAPQVFDVVEQARLIDAAIATQAGRHRGLDRRRRRDARPAVDQGARRRHPGRQRRLRAR